VVLGRTGRVVVEEAAVVGTVVVVEVVDGAAVLAGLPLLQAAAARSRRAIRPTERRITPG